MSVYDNFTTLNDENLDAACSQDYQLAWQLEAAEMVATLNDAIAGGAICSGGSDKFDVTSSTTTFFAQGAQVRLVAEFKGKFCLQSKWSGLSLLTSTFSYFSYILLD